MASALSISPGLFAQEEGTEPPQEEAAVEDTIVVTASRIEQKLTEAPAAMTVISNEELMTAPADDYGDLLRNVPGLNVSQMSARDVQLSGRQATSSLANSTLALVDGRSLYLDFFGFVMWDLLPVDLFEVEQIEVVRGPGSAVWGANALTGVVNVITKPPSAMQGTRVRLGGGELSTLYASASHAAVSGKLGYKISGGYYEQDPYQRPTGNIPGTDTPYPDYENEGTAQPRADARLDYEVNDESYLSFSLGYGGTDGIAQTGTGPFDIQRGAGLGYGQVSYSWRALQVTGFINRLDGEAANLLTVGPDGLPLQMLFATDTYNLDVGNSNLLGDKHLLSYGANARHNEFDLSIAPLADTRDQWGVYLQDEIFLSPRFRWLIGARYDEVDPIDPIVSPRTSFLFSPTPRHTLRASYNEAFRAPSVTEQFIDITILNQITIPAVPALGLPEPVDYAFPSHAIGNLYQLQEELTAYEIGWVGTFGRRTTVTLSLYRNDLEQGSDFYPSKFYDSTNPPPDWPLPAFVLDFPPAAGAFPSEFSYRNVAEITNRGVEVSLDMRPSPQWSWFVNYSWQDEPDVKGISPDETNLPPENRINVGASWTGERWFANGNLNYSDGAFWTDVLDARYWGPTEAYTMTNLTLGWNATDWLSLSLIGQNLLDEEVQQHVFGDIISRKVTAQLIFDF